MRSEEEVGRGSPTERSGRQPEGSVFETKIGIKTRPHCVLKTHRKSSLPCKTTPRRNFSPKQYKIVDYRKMGLRIYHSWPKASHIQITSHKTDRSFGKCLCDRGQSQPNAVAKHRTLLLEDTLSKSLHLVIFT